MEHPLNGSVEKDGVVEVGYLAIEPEMDAGDGTGFEVGQVFAQRGGGGSLRKDVFDGVEGESEDQVVEGRFLVFLVLIGDTNLDM